MGLQVVLVLVEQLIDVAVLLFQEWRDPGAPRSERILRLGDRGRRRTHGLEAFDQAVDIGDVGADVTLDPKIETIPGSAVVRGLIANMVTGIESAAADALTLRTDYKTTLDLRLTNNMNDIADPKTVPGSGYYS
ncbi:hypothetical protein LO763_01810 [Glycomyces sp. A-F 0318]|uniref:hypothetical protein n=1 Tax=Glycomyces amatae TaxID=2881355 RepID=UPI001E283894|nr:hypothetical protein [Glycomyces amatae]MCD0442362.1 hypothetical protein [Glycomyces amatae]